MLDIKQQVKIVEGCRYDDIPEFVLASEQPLLLKGLVADWPLVQAGLQSDAEADAYLRKFYTDKSVVFYEAEAEKRGRFFYADDCGSLDFKSSRARLDEVLDLLAASRARSNSPTYYVGSTTVDVCLPDFRADNDLNINHLNPLVSIWIGNRSCVAAHYDAPDNIACCVVGKRRFTLFPIEQVENLYPGPMDFTPSGQIISMVDFENPDYEKFPKFKTAVDHALVAELEPGDALLLPSMWWHHVESLSDFNVLVNYWWREYERFMDVPTNVLHHAMLSIRDLPEKEKRAWKALFDYYVFGPQEHKYDHIPEAAQGFLQPLDDRRARQLRAWLLNKLNR